MTQKKGKKKKKKQLTDKKALMLGETLFDALGIDRVSDLIVGGLECGSYATFGVDTAKYVKPADEKLYWMSEEDKQEGKPFRHVQYPLSEGGAATLYCRYDEEEGEEDRRFTLDLTAVKRGLGRLFVQYPRLYADVLQENDDALTADAFLQCCLLGDVVYG
jgi:hypothetical protein